MDNSKSIGKKKPDNGSNYEVKRRKNHILAIAIGKYQEIARLAFPVKECEALVETLTQLYDFELEPRKVLYDEEATSDTIYTELYNLDDLTQNDNLILIFSGHGFLDKKREIGYWVPVDGKKLEKEDGRITNPAALKDYISISHVVDNLKTVKAHHIV
ncbi:MAG: caspase family protein, partial [Cyanothece sp. SIO1E1]|nr:caspase family protein [Cyanothece sp. SIO1E1]